MARPGAPFVLMTVAKSLAIRLALTSPGSARTVNSFATAGWAGSGASARIGLAAAGATDWRAYRPSALPRQAPCHNIRLAVFIDRTAVRHHAIRDFLGLGGQVPSRQQHGETQPGSRADGTAPWPPPKPPQTKTKKCRAPALTRSARHHAQPWPANATSSRQSTHRSSAELQSKAGINAATMARLARFDDGR